MILIELSPVRGTVETVEANIRRFTRVLAEELEAATIISAKRLAEWLESELVRQAPINTGALRQSIDVGLAVVNVLEVVQRGTVSVAVSIDISLSALRYLWAVNALTFFVSVVLDAAVKVLAVIVYHEFGEAIARARIRYGIPE